jgi:hypothetical protein
MFLALFLRTEGQTKSKNGGMNVNLTLIQTTSAALNANLATAFFHGPIPIISNSDPLTETVAAIPAARFLADWIPEQPVRAERFGKADDYLARFRAVS